MAGKITQVAFGSPQLPRDKNVAAYCRVSSGKDAMLHSLAAQVSYYSELIQNHAGWEYAGVYAEMKIANLIQFESLNTQEIGRNKELLTYPMVSEAFIFCNRV